MSITGYYWLTFNQFRVRWVSLQIFNRDDLFGVSSKIPDPKPRKETITTYTRYLLHMLLPIGLRNVLCCIRLYSGYYQVKQFSKLYSYFIPFTAFVKSQDPGISYSLSHNCCSEPFSPVCQSSQFHYAFLSKHEKL